jgi:hypothetical protein
MLKSALALAISLCAVCSLAAAAPASAGLVIFHSPSDNIGCTLDGHAIRCDVAEHTWVAPPKPKYCDVDWGGGVDVGRKGKAGYVCAGDTTLHQGNALAYGQSVQQGRFKCTSNEAGMRCLNTDNKHGFLVSRDAVKLF